MIRFLEGLAAAFFASWVLMASTICLGADDTAAGPETQPKETAATDDATTAPEKAAKELSPAMAKLRDQVRSVLAMHRKQPFSTRGNSPTEIMNYCLAFGCTTEIALEGNANKPINGITALCWNYPCNGVEMLGPNRGRISARIGYGCQERPGEFLAMLAMSRVQPDYPVRVGENVRNVADVVEAEKLGCRSGTDLSLKLIGLSYYVDEPEWKNDIGETWSIDRMIREEIAKPVITDPEEGVNRLMGLSYAVSRREKRKQPIDGQYQRAEKYTTDFQKFALQLQNSDGSWGPQYLAARSTSRDAASQLRSTGRITEWLAMSLPDEKLEDAQVVGAVECLVRLLASQRYARNAPSLSTWEIAAVGHGLHALNVYDQRVFRPADMVEKKESETANPAAASRENSSSVAR